MLALTIRQPWAWAICHAGKRIENRSWTTSYRGQLAIHASKSAPSQAMLDAVAELARDAQPGRRQSLARTAAAARAAPRGAIVAVCTLADVVATSHDVADVWADEDGFWWRLKAVRVLAEPVDCTGKLRLWEAPSAVARAVQAQLGVT